ncbi:MAG: flagellar assembly protein FliW [Dehalococcoidia bacterium]|nr:flagellar assembly protein FliW [Dehalococcoidia bacterium]
MRFITTRFGRPESVEAPDDAVIRFPTGIVGFESYQLYAHLTDATHAPLEWLQSLEDPDLCFAVTDPALFFADYAFDLSPDDVKTLELERAEDAEVLVILVLRDNPRESTANLLAPIVVNRRTRVGRQVVLAGASYSVRTPLFADVSAVEYAEA